MKSIVFLLLVLILVALAKQTKNHNSEHGGKILTTHSRHDHADFGSHEADTEESPPREKSFEDYKAELQDYLDLEKENENGLEDDTEMMENSNDDDGDDDADMMEKSNDDDDDAEIMEKSNDDDDAEMMEKNRDGDDEKMDKHVSSKVQKIKNVNYNDAETMKEDDTDVVEHMADDEGDNSDEEIEAMDKGDKTGKGENKKFVIEMDSPPAPLKGRSKLVKSQWCRCNNWKRAYYRERHYKNYYYRLYITYYRHYRKYYKKYIAYYRHYRRCYHRNRTCQRKYYRLRQGYKNMVKSHSHLLKTCKYRG